MFIVVTSLYGEYIVSRDVNGFIQLLCFVGLVLILIFLGDETVSVLFKNKKEEK
jgi:uncharacterized membrane protein YphA (DoxX/SURF4 family)